MWFSLAPCKFNSFERELPLGELRERWKQCYGEEMIWEFKYLWESWTSSLRPTVSKRLVMQFSFTLEHLEVSYYPERTIARTREDWKGVDIPQWQSRMS